MKLALSLFKYFPFGGLQRDFLRIARTCRDRGHEIDVYTMKWEGEREPGLNVHLIPTSGFQNYTRCASFAKQLTHLLSQKSYDLHIGFNKIPGLDVYYAADVCYPAQINQTYRFFYRWLPNYRQWTRLEKAVFDPAFKTQILLISPLQQAEYTYHYHTQANRFHLLPPGINKDRIAPPHAESIRNHVRKALNVTENDILLLMVGSGFHTKGVERTIISMHSLPRELKKRCQLFVIGQGRRAPLEKFAHGLGLLNQVHFLGGRHDVPAFLLAADFLLHPAIREAAGIVLLEALVSGLPVLTTAVCGYAHYIEQANAGMVIPMPFDQTALNKALEKMISSDLRKIWQQNALQFAKTADIYSLPEKAADAIETFGSYRPSKQAMT